MPLSVEAPELNQTPPSAPPPKLTRPRVGPAQTGIHESNRYRHCP